MQLITGPMERAVKSYLKGCFEEYVHGLDTNVNCSQLPATLHRLELKQEKVNEMIEESSSACPFEFTNGIIGSIKLMPSWSGNLEVVANDVRLNLAFCPIKAMKKAMMPPEDDETDLQNQVPIDVQLGLSALRENSALHGCGQVEHGGDAWSQMPSQQVAPCYCRNHETPGKRRKGQPKVVECTSCRMPVQTNYVDFALCPACSRREKLCMNCGSDASFSTSPPVPVAQSSEPSRPRYCSAHSTSEKRRKGDPRSCTCKGCRMPLSTNYVEFAYCPSCSNLEQRCMCCGADAWSLAARQPDMDALQPRPQATDDDRRPHYREVTEVLLPPPPPQSLPRRRSMSTGSVRSALGGDRGCRDDALGDAGRRRTDAGARSSSMSGIRREVPNPWSSSGRDAPFGTRQLPISGQEGLPQRWDPERSSANPSRRS